MARYRRREVLELLAASLPHCALSVSRSLLFSFKPLLFSVLTIRSCVSEFKLSSFLRSGILHPSPLVVALRFGGNPPSDHPLRDHFHSLLSEPVDGAADEMTSLLHEVAVDRVREHFCVVLAVALVLVREERPARDVQTR